MLKKPVHFIGLGGAGKNIIEQMNDIYPHNLLHVISFPKPETFPTSIDFIDFEPLIKQKSTFSDFEMYVENMALSIEIEMLLKPGFDYILLGGLGGFSGSVLMIKICEHLKKLNVTAKTVTCIPFQIESSSRKLMVSYCLQKLNQLSYNKTLALDLLLETHGHLTIEAALSLANQWMIDSAMGFLNAQNAFEFSQS